MGAPKKPGAGSGGNASGSASSSAQPSAQSAPKSAKHAMFPGLAIDDRPDLYVQMKPETELSDKAKKLLQAEMSAEEIRKEEKERAKGGGKRGSSPERRRSRS